MKRFILILFVTVLVSGLIFGVCVIPASAQTDVTTLSFALQSPSVGWGAKVVKAWTKGIEDATNGKVKFDIYWSQTLTKVPDTWNALKYGIAKTALCVHGTFKGLTPVSDVLGLPFLPYESAKQGSAIFWKLHEKFPAIRNELKDNKVLLLYTSTPYFLINTKREIKTMEDLKGLKLRVLGEPPPKALRALGATPTVSPMAATYLNIQKGVIDGMAVPWEALYSFRQYEVVKYYTYLPFFVAHFSISMNHDTWNKLSPDIQKQIEKSGFVGLKGSKWWGDFWFDQIAKVAYEEIKKKGYPMIEYTLPADELKRWQDIAGRPLWEDWVKKTEAAGHPEAREILNTVLELIKTYQP